MSHFYPGFARHDQSVPKRRSHRFATKCLTSLGPKIWNNLPAHRKASENLSTFKKLLKKYQRKQYVNNLI